MKDVYLLIVDSGKFNGYNINNEIHKLIANQRYIIKII